MAALLVYPGQLSELVDLNDVLREEHEQTREARQREIDDRKKKHIPLDDSTDWASVDELRKKLSECKQDSTEINVLASEIKARTQGNAISPVPEFVPNPLLDGIKVQFRIISAADARMLSAQMQELWRRYRDALRRDEFVKAQEIVAEIDQHCGRYVQRILARIEGIDGLQELDKPETIDALEAAGVLGFLYSACRHFLELPRPKALRCGVPAQLT